jgi:hypothetical protein
MNFEQLIQAFEQTHNYLQGRAVSTVNQSLTICNWLFRQPPSLHMTLMLFSLPKR